MVVWVLGGVADYFFIYLFFKFSDGGCVGLVFLGVVANGSLGFWVGWLIYFLIFRWWLCGFVGLDRRVWCFGCGG